ncbi:MULTISPECIES: hypothetical protein [unclassified Peribacillus]|uniref:hypothetical protein n=1 Tax=unclassified Peribacillus TaxID=2675266 RepID=UPI001912741F|nr:MULTISPECIES: hypothetical protein [unclassified Peribacillus]MBK5500129.1 hypothetical protein [Peribacillus sp. TH14]WMX54823.1 hypothetical protein RE409_22620 [Peribacillus sp. R9-11]
MGKSPEVIFSSIVYSKLLFMTEEERDQWLKEQRTAGNPDLLRLDRLVNELYREFYTGEEDSKK